jgi:hypothetical protein
MKGFAKIPPEETESIYNDVKRLVQTWRDEKNPDLDAAPFSQCIPGLSDYTIPLVDAQSSFDDLTYMCKSLDDAFPGAKLADEPLPDGSRRYYINVPLYVPKGQSRYGGGGVRRSTGKPSTEWFMFLVMIEAISGVVLYFRL